MKELQGNPSIVNPSGRYPWKSDTDRYRYGLYLGRFQPLHIGHTSIIDKMLDECENVVIAVGSAQAKGSVRNPLDYDFRRMLIVDTYFKYVERLIVLPIKDREKYSDDSSWGDYLFQQIYEQSGIVPDVIYEGYENERSHWYDGFNVPVVKVSRYQLPISGTDLRKTINADLKMFALPYLPIPTHKYYDDIRKEITKCFK